MKFYKNKIYIAIHHNHRYGNKIVTFKGKPYNKYEYSNIRELTPDKIPTDKQFRSQCRVVIENPLTILNRGEMIIEV